MLWEVRLLTGYGREGCIIWAEFVQTRIGCFVEYTKQIITDQMASSSVEKSLTQTRPNGATLAPVSSRAPLMLQHQVLGCRYLFFSFRT